MYMYKYCIGNGNIFPSESIRIEYVPPGNPLPWLVLPQCSLHSPQPRA